MCATGLRLVSATDLCECHLALAIYSPSQQIATQVHRNGGLDSLAFDALALAIDVDSRPPAFRLARKHGYHEGAALGDALPEDLALHFSVR